MSVGEKAENHGTGCTASGPLGDEGTHAVRGGAEGGRTGREAWASVWLRRALEGGRSVALVGEKGVRGGSRGGGRGVTRRPVLMAGKSWRDRSWHVWQGGGSQFFLRSSTA